MPGDGWYQFLLISKSGDGSKSKTYTSPTLRYSGSSGGSGCIVRYSKVKLNKNQSVNFTISNSLTSMEIAGNKIELSAGRNGTSSVNRNPSVGGAAGILKSAKLENMKVSNGQSGENGFSWEPGGIEGGAKRRNILDGYTTESGKGEDISGAGNGQGNNGTGTGGKVVVFKGNTNRN